MVNAAGAQRFSRCRRFNFNSIIGFHHIDLISLGRRPHCFDQNMKELNFRRKMVCCASSVAFLSKQKQIKPKFSGSSARLHSHSFLYKESNRAGTNKQTPIFDSNWLGCLPTVRAFCQTFSPSSSSLLLGCCPAPWTITNKPSSPLPCIKACPPPLPHFLPCMYAPKL